MAYLTTPFPDRIAYGASGGPEFRTDVVETGGGRESRNSRWPIGRGRWNVAHGVKSPDDMALLDAFFRACKGKANTFPFRDYTDYQVTAANGALGSGNGTGGPTFQLNKVYTAGGQTDVRPIVKPDTVSFQVQRNGSPVTIGASAGNIAVDYATGIVTFVADASATGNSITVGATTTVVLATNPGTLVGGQLLYLSGFTGADAALVNGLAHPISSVTGTGPYTFVLATNTAGKTITLGSGIGRKFPQAADALTWSGAFYVPCRFDTDRMIKVIENYRLISWAEIPIIEVLS